MYESKLYKQYDINKKKRVCYNCETTTARVGMIRSVRKDGIIKKIPYELWYRYGDNNWLCIDCYQKLVIWPNKKDRKFCYKGKIFVSETQRIGVCNFCRAVKGEINGQIDKLCKQTHMAHFEYDDNNPEAHRLELCNSCHYFYDERQQYIDNRGKRIPTDRQCYDCGSKNTYTRNGEARWLRIKDLENKYRCWNCYLKWRNRIKGGGKHR